LKKNFRKGKEKSINFSEWSKKPGGAKKKVKSKSEKRAKRWLGPSTRQGVKGGMGETKKKNRKGGNILGITKEKVAKN